ncbi:MAG: Holliday junction branch migration DNA helicase RuvB [Patescibacteria group bacterium]
MSNPIQAKDKAAPQDKHLDAALRPHSWNEYIGQDHVKKNLNILLDAAKKRGEPIEHLLFYGPAGLGKTSLAYLVAREFNTNIRISSGPALERVGDLAAILTNLLPNDILFIDEAHRLNKLIEEILYPAMESRTLDIIIGKGPSARTLQLDLPPFTIVAATTRIGLLSGPLRSRFGATFRLDPYSAEDIGLIIRQSARVLGITVAPEGVETIARAARSTPRVANRLLKRVRDYAQVHDASVVTADIADKTLRLLDIDDLGLEAMDRKILSTIAEKFSGGPVGLRTIAAATQEEEDTIEDVYEPYLLQLGFLERTPRGRITTDAARRHLGLAATAQLFG